MSEVTVICIGDPHFKTDNIPEVELFVDRVEKLVTEKSPAIIVIMGDVLDTHERLHTIPLNKAYDFIRRMGNITDTFVLVGNHDMINNQQYLNENHWMNSMKFWDRITIVDKVIQRNIREYKFTFVPYVSPGRFEEALNTLHDTLPDKVSDWRASNCIFAHQEFYGCKLGAINSEIGDRWHIDYPQVVSGHIHGKQRMNNIYYMGAAMQHAFGESDKNIIALLTFQTGNMTIEEIDLGLPRKRIIYKNIEDLASYTPPTTEDKLKVTVSGQYDSFKAFKKSKKYRELLDTGVKVVFKPKLLENIKDTKIPESETDFHTILRNIVYNHKKQGLVQAFEKIVNDRDIKVDDIIFL